HFFVSFLIGVVFFYLFHYFPFSTVIVSLTSAVYLTAKKKYSLIFVVLLGITYAFLRYEPVRELPYARDKLAVNGVFESSPVKTDKGSLKQILSITKASDINTGERLNELAGKEVAIFSDIEFELGTEYGLAVKFQKSRKRFNPGQQMRDDMYATLLYVYDSGKKRNSLNSKIQECRYRINRYIEEHIKGDSGAFITSITTGQRLNMTDELKEAFNATGLAHILSISGTHFGLFSVLLFGIFRFFIKVLPYRLLQRITIYLTPSQAAAILSLPFMLAYLGLSGGSIPAVRSFIMIGLFLLGLIINRKGFWLNSLVFAAFILILYEPEWIFSLSFQLSFLAVLFIGFSLQKEEAAEKDTGGLIRHIRNALYMSLAASIGTAPLVAYYFHYFSLISPVSNLVIAPLIGFVLIPLSVISSFLFLITGHFVFTPLVSVISDISIYLVKLFSQIPFADLKMPAFPPVLLLLFYAGFIFYFLFDKRRYLLIIPIVPVVIYLLLTIFEKEKLNVTFLDAGQGDAAVIELPDGKTMLIDTGRTGWETLSFLKYRGKKTIDMLALSHVHPDHTGGLDYLSQHFGIREIWDNGRMILPDTVSSIKHRSFSRGDVIEGKGYKIYALHPYPEFYTMKGNEHDAANNDSLVLRIEGDNKSFLFAGDIEEDAEENIMHLGKWLKSDVMKVPHHGGKASAYQPFIETVSPRIAVISAGRENPFGHPHQEMLDALNEVKIFRTDIDGAVKIHETDDGLQIKTYKDFQFDETGSLTGEMKNFRRLFEKW
ncbi:MAG: DNA internalization-related competence protein ComEC/Rec2, partial [Nitrospira sp.]|nr:DNA internalization-related competence protein ComEC/Rec2 [Nitrospira sp.]